MDNPTLDLPDGFGDPFARMTAEIRRLREALEQIRDIQPDEAEGRELRAKAGAEIETCEECAEWRRRKHPIQHLCDRHYRALNEAERADDIHYTAQVGRMRGVARTALGRPEQGL
jgi:hypothetical protein